MYNHMGREDTFIYPILLDMFSDPGKGLELLAKQETFIKQGIGIPSDTVILLGRSS